MTALSILSIIAFFVYLNLGLHILYTNQQSGLNRNFFYFSLFFALASFVCAVYFSNADPQIKKTLSPLAPLPNLLFTYFILRFFLIFTGQYKNKRVRLLFLSLAWVIPGFLAYKSVFYNSIIKDYPGGHWMLYLLIQFVFCTTSLMLVSIWWKRTKIPKEKKQGKIMTCFGLGTIIVSTIVDYLTYDIYTYVSLSVVSSTVIWIFAVYYIVIRHSFMKLSPKMLSLEIINSIHEMVMLIDLNLELSFVNDHARTVFAQVPGSVTELHKMTAERENHGGTIEEFILGDKDSASHTVTLNTGQGRIPFDITLKKIFTSDNDLLGILYMAREIPGFDILARQYRLTGREEQIVLKMLSGMTNTVIAAKLGVTERTIKAHITSIYTKIGITNRIGLYNLFKRSAPLTQEGDAPPRLLLRRKPGQDATLKWD